MYNYLKWIGFAFLVSLMACDEDDNVLISNTIAVTFENLPADPPTGYDPTNGSPLGITNRFTFFRFSDSSLVAVSDSATTKWDIGFRAQDIIVNAGSSGPGNAAAFIYTGLFDELKEIPADSTFRQDQSGNLAIGRTWYNYDRVAMILVPKPGKILVIRTADNKFVKMEILSYYKDAPVSPKLTDPARYYTFRYVHQANGTLKFE